MTLLAVSRDYLGLPPDAEVAVAAAAPERSCRNCRHSAYHAHSQELRCRQPNSAAVRGTVVRGPAFNTPAERDRLPVQLAARCRNYQEER